ncbi:MAG: type II toxin-antitoxin system VapB family antitoxin [Terriglobales bacterium]
MRTTLDLPDGLLEQAQHALGLRTKTETVVMALEEAIRRQRVEQLIGRFGQLEFEGDPTELRRRRDLR